MGDKSPKSKTRNDKQKTAAKKDAQAKAKAKQTPKTEVPKRK